MQASGLKLASFCALCHAYSTKFLHRRIPSKSATTQRPDMHRQPVNVCFVPILLQKSFWGVERKFLEPLMRFARGDVRDHVG
jgi:hypothetical protein